MQELTISQIRSLSGTLPDDVFYTTDAGREGIWQYDPGSTASDNSGTVLRTADGKVIKRVYSGPASVKWFGAKGDGTTNDATAIQNTIDALAANGGAAYMPAGTYRITATIQLKEGVSLIGEETQNNTVAKGTRLKYEGTGIAIQCYAPGDPGTGGVATFSNIIIKGLFLEEVGSAAQIGIDLQGFRWCRIESVSIYGFNIGLHTYHNYYSTYRHLLFTQFRTYAIYSENQDNNTKWEKIKVSSAASTGVLHAARFSYAYDISMTDFSCETNTNHALYLEHCRGARVSGYYYEATADNLVSAILITACKGVSIAGGAFQGHAKALRGIFGSGSDDVMIFGNWFNGFTGAAIVNGFITQGDNKNFLQVNNSIDEIDGDYDRILAAGQGGGELIGFRHIEWCMYEAAPGTGDWKKGDIIWRKSADKGQPIGFICIETGTPGTWVPFGQIGVRTTTAAPAIVPNFLGEEVFDTTNGKWYKSTGTSSSSWVALN